LWIDFEAWTKERFKLSSAEADPQL